MADATVLRLPQRADRTHRHTPDGQVYSLADDLWVLHDNLAVRIRWDGPLALLPPDLLMAAKEVASLQLLAFKPGTVCHQVDALRRLCAFLQERTPVVGRFDSEQVASFFDHAPKRQNGPLKTFFAKWHAQNLPGIDKTLVDAIKGRRFKSPTQGHITALDPETGPYLDAEMEAADLALRTAFEVGSLADDQYLIAMVFRLYGQRPVMVANQTLADVRLPSLDGSPQAEIRFPLAKKRTLHTTHGPWRPAPMLFTKVLERHVAALLSTHPSVARDRIPLFPIDSPSWSGRWKNMSHQGKGQQHPDRLGHCTPYTVSDRYRVVMEGLGVVSPRTGKPMVFSPMRERHTIGTLLALKGCSAAEIAAWLHHDDLGTCEAYIELGTRHHQLMHSLLDGQFLHLSGRFLGEVVAPSSVDAIQDSALIPDGTQPGAPVLGGCAAGGCKALDELAAPYACLDGCPNLRLSLHADLRPLIADLVARKTTAKAQRQDEYQASLNRHIAQAVAAQHALDAARQEKEAGHG
jgi:hypothetical protein